MCESAEDASRKLGYLSGAPRVSTRPEAGAAGPRTHVLGVMNAFRCLGWEVQPYIVGDRVPLAWVAGENGIQALRVSKVKRIAADLARLSIGVVHGWRALREMGQVDWVYERCGAFQAMGWWFQRKGIPWILETNAVLFREATEDRSTVALGALLEASECWAYRQCDILVCVSEALARLIIKASEVDPRKIIILSNGADTYHFEPSKYMPIRLFNKATIGFVGQLNRWQRLDILMEVLGELRQEGIDIGLTIVGEGPMRVEWEHMSSMLRQEKNIKFVGQKPWHEVPAYIAGFDLAYVGQVPLAAGEMYLSPLKLYEYAAMGKPIVAAAYEDARNLLGRVERGYLFTPGDKKNLKRVLRQTWKERDKWGLMGEALRDLVVHEHSWVSRVQELIVQTEQILKKRYERNLLMPK